MTELRIGQRVIGIGRPTLVIAEIGVNHDGSADRARQLVDIAADCGADAVKLQVFSARALMHESADFATYQKDRVAAASPAEMLRKYELSHDDVRSIVQVIRRRGLIPLATPFSLSDLPIIKELDLPAIKIASPDLVNKPLLSAAARLGRPILVSTGAASMDEVARTVEWLRHWGAPFALLHCVSSYPTSPADAHLAWIGELAQAFHAPVGFSDHTQEPLTGAFAVAAGAVIVEKHLTYDRTAAGPDHLASADPSQFRHYIQLIRQAEILRGAPGKRVLDCEQDVRRVSRQSLVLRRSLRPGQVITEEDLDVQRPGTGIPAAQVDRVVGRFAACDIAAGTQLTWNMLDSNTMRP